MSLNIAVAEQRSKMDHSEPMVLSALLIHGMRTRFSERFSGT